MERELAFRTDLYRGTAPFYDRYRPPYPEALLEDLAGRLPVSGNGRLLDLACGTGQIAVPLAGRFAEVVAVDQEDEMVSYGRAKADGAGVSKIRWVAASAETVEIEGYFELATIGNAFHRLRRTEVAERVFSWLEPGGGIALLWGDILGRGEADWRRAMGALFEEWMTKLDATDRLVGGWEAAMDRHPHEQVLIEAGFDYAGKYEFVTDQTWTVEALTGLIYSTSFLNREALGSQANAFEADLSALLHSYKSDGVFEVAATYAYELATKPRT
jgi:SAM-dependent methyltransferase